MWRYKSAGSRRFNQRHAISALCEDESNTLRHFGRTDLQLCANLALNHYCAILAAAGCSLQAVRCRLFAAGCSLQAVHLSAGLTVLTCQLRPPPTRRHPTLTKTAVRGPYKSPPAALVGLPIDKLSAAERTCYLRDVLMPNNCRMNRNRLTMSRYSDSTIQGTICSLTP